MSTELDAEALLVALGVVGATSVEPVSGGSDTLIWRVAHRDRLYALRVFRAEQAEMCAREERLMRAARERELPVPHVYASAISKGRPAMLLEWCGGRPMGHELLARPWRVWPLGVLFGRAQARIHNLTAPEALLPPDRSWLEWLSPDDHALRSRLVATEPLRHRLLHLDYHLLNVMTDGRRVTGVLDWSNARSGDPRADWARTLSILRLDSDVPGALRLPGQVLLRLFELGWRRGYRQVAGPLTDLAPFNAWAGAIMEQDLRPRPGRRSRVTPRQVRRIRAWIQCWKRRAGRIPPRN